MFIPSQGPLSSGEKRTSISLFIGIIIGLLLPVAWRYSWISFSPERLIFGLGSICLGLGILGFGRLVLTGFVRIAFSILAGSVTIFILWGFFRVLGVTDALNP